ncbi:MAG: hypothetical protein ACRDIB_00020, partial [Ardenticatenaceae bacterium]
MAGRKGSRWGSWWLVGVCVMGLLVTSAVAGVVGLAFSARIQYLTGQTLRYNLELKHSGIELKVAVLELRHRHRTIIQANQRTHYHVAELQSAYAHLLSQIDRLDRLALTGVGLPQSPPLRQMAEAYQADFWPVIKQHPLGSISFAEASDAGLVQLDHLLQASEAIRQAGSQQSQATLKSLEYATLVARGALLTALASLLLAAAGLAWYMIHVVQE